MHVGVYNFGLLRLTVILLRSLPGLSDISPSESDELVRCCGLLGDTFVEKASALESRVHNQRM